MQVVKKIQPKSMIGDVRELIKGHKDGAVIPLYRVFGIANGYRTGNSTFGEWVGFVGTFEAITFDENGEVLETYESGQVFLHDPIQGMLVQAIKAQDPNPTVEFCVDVNVEVDSNQARGYSYLEKPIVKAQEADALKALRQAALPTPKEKPAQEKPPRAKGK